MALREIRKFDDPILRQTCRKVETIDDKIRELLHDMAETMYHEPNSGGLAANQIGILKRLVVIDMGEGLYKLVNPQIINQKGIQHCVEGCLSFPGIWGKVKRPFQVTVHALDENGNEIEIKANDQMAKCLCHEIDHLNGIVFTDKVTSYLS